MLCGVAERPQVICQLLLDCCFTLAALLQTVVHLEGLDPTSVVQWEALRMSFTYCTKWWTTDWVHSKGTGSWVLRSSEAIDGTANLVGVGGTV
jgi:hypothetical protein